MGGVHWLKIRTGPETEVILTKFSSLAENFVKVAFHLFGEVLLLWEKEPANNNDDKNNDDDDDVMKMMMVINKKKIISMSTSWSHSDTICLMAVNQHALLCNMFMFYCSHSQVDMMVAGGAMPSATITMALAVAVNPE